MTIDELLPTWDWRSAHATRVAAPPERCRYWRVIGPFSAITRREMLAAIRRRAEA